MLLNLEYWIINTLQTLFDQFGWLGVAVMIFLENATGLVPGEIVLGMSGWLLISRHELPLSMIFLGSFYAALGGALGASVAYWAARLGGRPLVDRVTRWLRVPAQHIDRAEALFCRWGAGLALFGRMIPGMRTVVSIPAGLAGVPFGQYSLASFTGIYAWCVLLIGAGFFLGQEWSRILDLLKQYALPLAGAGLLLAALLWWLQRQARKRLAAYAGD
jgi:membrane protein DedA with SNARE-associated domain